MDNDAPQRVFCLQVGPHPRPRPVMVGVVPHSGLALNEEVESLAKMGAV